MSENPHGHYFKDVRNLAEIDVYRVLRLFNVTDPALAHAAKKLLVAGGRGAGKSQEQDVREALVSCQRFLAMNEEDAVPARTSINVVQGIEVAQRVATKDLRAIATPRGMSLTELKRNLARKRKK